MYNYSKGLIFYVVFGLSLKVCLCFVVSSKYAYYLEEVEGLWNLIGEFTKNTHHRSLLPARVATCAQPPAKAHLCPVHGSAGQSRKTNSFCFVFLYALCKSAWLAVWLNQLLSPVNSKVLRMDEPMYLTSNRCEDVTDTGPAFSVYLSKIRYFIFCCCFDVSDYGHLKE